MEHGYLCPLLCRPAARPLLPRCRSRSSSTPRPRPPAARPQPPAPRPPGDGSPPAPGPWPPAPAPGAPRCIRSLSQSVACLVTVSRILSSVVCRCRLSRLSMSEFRSSVSLSVSVVCVVMCLCVAVRLWSSRFFCALLLALARAFFIALFELLLLAFRTSQPSPLVVSPLDSRPASGSTTPIPTCPIPMPNGCWMHLVLILLEERPFPSSIVARACQRVNVHRGYRYRQQRKPR